MENIMDSTKKCSKCEEVKSVGEGGAFNKHGKKSDGSIKWQSWCKPCFNKDRYKGTDKLEAHRKAVLKYSANNPQVQGLNSAIQRSTLSEAELLKGATRDFVRAETRFDYHLRDLLTEKTGVPHELDHITPLARGGIHRLENLRSIPASLNRTKRNLLDAEWLG
jgi:hypothetical protein